MIIGPYQFRLPGWLPIVFMVAMLSLLLQLGSWQLNRASLKQQLRDDFSGREHGTVVRFVNHSDEQLELLQYASMSVTGRFVGSHRILLDNRMNGSELGYHALGVLQLSQQQRFVLVNLGWVSMNGTRDVLPKIELPTGEVSFPVRIKNITRNVFTLGGLDIRGDGMVLMPVLDKPQLEEWLNLELSTAMVLVDPAATFGYVRQWQAHLGISPSKHVGYAVQWFALALALSVIFVVVNTKRISDKTDDKQDEING